MASSAGYRVTARCWHSSRIQSDPDFAVRDRELVDEERLDDGHSVTAWLAVPERAHVLVALPLRNRIPRIGIILIAKKPLVL
jgi:hypothetical protein